MYRAIVSVVAIAMLVCGTAAAQNNGFGLGVILGEPTGLSCKLWRDNSAAIDGAAAWSFDKKDALYLHADYLFHNFSLVKSNIPVYYGIGGRVKFEEKSKAGVRIPFGIDFMLTEVPLDIFFELVPLFDLVRTTGFGVNGGIGIRYYLY
jgi:hypothetical protein